MRLWSLSPDLMDRAALVACWRETLLAQKVLAGGTRGYTRHPQLARWREHPEPLDAIGAYLHGLRTEATAREYRFDPTRIQRDLEPSEVAPIPVTTGQLRYELEHLRAKVSDRQPDWLERLPTADAEEPPRAHPVFLTREGDVEGWEARR